MHGTRKCSWLSESLINTGSVEDELLDTLQRFLVAQPDEKPVHVVDIGAKIGFVSLFSASLKSNVHVSAIEATPWHYNLFEASLALFPNRDRIKLFKVGLGPTNSAYSELCMRIQNGNSASTAAEPGSCKGTDGTTVPLQTLDSIVARGAWNLPITVLKIDVEGFEPLIFQGADDVLSKNPPLLIIAEYIPFRIIRAIPGCDPYNEFFRFFPSSKFNFRLLSPKAHGLSDQHSSTEVLAAVRAWDNATYGGGDLVMTPL